jgi:predicted Fe-Mo cluster-binding NifX family protein
MKIAFTTSGNDLDAPLDSRFGRAPKFIIYDLESGAFEVIHNEKNMNAAQGAGIQAAETVVRLGVSCVMTGHCGPKAFRVLSAAGVKVYSVDAATVSEALDRFRTERIGALDAADVEGHHV